MPVHPTRAVYRLNEFSILESSGSGVVTGRNFLDSTVFDGPGTGTVAINTDSVLNETTGAVIGLSSIIFEFEGEFRSLIPFGEELFSTTWRITMISKNKFGADLLPTFEYLNNPANFAFIKIQKAPRLDDIEAPNAAYTGDVSVTFSP